MYVRHLSIKDTLVCPNGVQIREVPLILLYNVSLASQPYSPCVSMCEHARMESRQGKGKENTSLSPAYFQYAHAHTAGS